jgi:hypothetical protein
MAATAAAAASAAQPVTGGRALVPAHGALAGELSQFFESAFHLLLHDRDIYPNGLFEARRAYGVCVQTSRHPLLNQYVHQLTVSIQSWLVQGEMQRVVLVVLEPPRTSTNKTPAPKCVERFVFEVRQHAGRR